MKWKNESFFLPDSIEIFYITRTFRSPSGRRIPWSGWTPKRSCNVVINNLRPWSRPGLKTRIHFYCYLHIHEFFLIFGLLGYVHINNSLFEAFVTADDLGGWRGSIVIDNNIAKKIWFGWISSWIQTGMCSFPISLSFGGLITRGSSVRSSFSFLRFLERGKGNGIWPRGGKKCSEIQNRNMH